MVSGAVQAPGRFATHPAFGVRRVLAGPPAAEPPRSLGLSWLSLGRDEQQRRRRAFFTQLLEQWAAEGDVTFSAGGLPPQAEARLTRLADVDVTAGRVNGPLSREAIVPLLDAEDVRVEGGEGTRRIVASERWMAVQQEVEAGGDVLAVTPMLEQAVPSRRAGALALLGLEYGRLVIAVVVGVLCSRALDGVLPWAVTIVPAVLVGYACGAAMAPLVVGATRRHESAPGSGETRLRPKRY